MRVYVEVGVHVSVHANVYVDGKKYKKKEKHTADVWAFLCDVGIYDW